MTLDITLSQLVAEQLPAGFTVSEAYIENRMKVNQMLIYEAAGVAKEEMYTISAYSDEWKVLISYLIIYDILSRILIGNFATSLGNPMDLDSEGAVKKIVTGPTEVEFHNSTQSLADIIKALGGGLFGGFLITACALGSKLGIKLPFCAGSKRGCISVVKTKFPHAGFNGIRTYGSDKPKSVG